MSGIATFTIKGFLYQFNKTLLEVLKAKDGVRVVVEGVVEDIHVENIAASGETTEISAIQCKYHESLDKFTISAIYKPLLQMMAHYAQTAPSKYKYILFVHFGGQSGTPPVLVEDDLRNALKSKNQSLAKTIQEAQTLTDLKGFLSVFRLEFGPSFDGLMHEVHDALKQNGIVSADIEYIAYPNALDTVATLSCQQSETDRTVSRAELLERIKNAKRIVVSAWTLAVYSKKKLLDGRRNQLKTKLGQNSRNRAYVLDGESITDFDTRAASFICEYVRKYHFKPAHIHPPTFCFAASETRLRAIQNKLYELGMVANDGYIGADFHEAHFLRVPIKSKSGGIVRTEFALRLLRWEGHGSALAKLQADDIFVVGNDVALTGLEMIHAPHFIAVQSLADLEYILGVSNVIE